MQEDRFYNYDFIDESVSSWGVACPVTMVFFHNAEIDKVKDIYWGHALFAVWDHARLNDGSGWIWDKDRGTKDVWWCSEIGYYAWFHLRVYAPNPPDYMYNPSYGRYVLGTTHLDQYPWELWHGYNEDAEEFFADWASDHGYTVTEDITYYKNYEPFRMEPIPGIKTYYYWDNDGWATVVYVP